MERETRIELATNSLEGCDSTIELLPPGGPTISHCKEDGAGGQTVPKEMTGRGPTGADSISGSIRWRR
jgi:hypothetical protein